MMCVCQFFENNPQKIKKSLIPVLPLLKVQKEVFKKTASTTKNLLFVVFNNF